MTGHPKTLGQALAPVIEPKPHSNTSLSITQRLLRGLVLVVYAAGILWALTLFQTLHLGWISGLVVSWIVLRWWLFAARKAKTQRSKDYRKPHFLLAGDQQRFMGGLRLDAKTAVIDGSNIYHFGHSNNLDAQVLGAVVAQLRDEGYRIVCFFDANIYHRLHEHGAFSIQTRHKLPLLMDIFGLEAKEIYVVPSGVQVDKYVLSVLHHMPRSFAVTIDKFRDYAKQYGAVMTGDEWRKGVTISKNEIKLFKHRYKTPVYVS